MPVSIRTSFPPVIDDERILLDHEIVFVEEIVSEDLVDALLGVPLERLRAERAEPKRAIGHHRAFESAELEAIGGGYLHVRHRTDGQSRLREARRGCGGKPR